MLFKPLLAAGTTSPRCLAARQATDDSSRLEVDRPVPHVGEYVHTLADTRVSGQCRMDLAAGRPNEPLIGTWDGLTSSSGKVTLAQQSIHRTQTPRED